MPHTPDPDTLLTIGEVARQSGLTASALRFYDREGVLVPAAVGCGHQQAWHEGGNGGYTPCRCCRAGSADPDSEPTLLPTASSPEGIREGLWPPGAQQGAHPAPRPGGAARTCACSACEAMFRERGAVSRGAPGASTPDPRSDPDCAAG